MLKEWTLSKQQLTVMIRDNASNAIKATDLLGIRCLGCMVHSIHLVLCSLLYNKTTRKAIANETKDGVYEEMDLGAFAGDESHLEYTDPLSESDTKLLKMLSSMISMFRNLARYFHASPKAHAKLCSLQGSNAVGTTVDCETRWSSTYDMLSRLVRLRSELEGFLEWVKTPHGRQEFSEFYLPSPSSEDWFIVQSMIILLRPFKNVKNILSGEKYPTLVLAFPCLRMIRKKLSTSAALDELKVSCSTKNIPDSIYALVDKIRLFLLRTFIKRFSNIPEEIAYASILHPNLSKMKYLSSKEKQAAIEFVTKQMMTVTTQNSIISSVSSLDLQNDVDSLKAYDDIFGSKQ